jgi:hypothetical protein
MYRGAAMARRAFAAFSAIGLLAFGAISGCGAGSVNSPVTVASGQKTGDIATVNGSVTVEDAAMVGAAASVNGAVSLGSKVTAESVKTVNGRVKIGDGTHVSGGVLTVNGAVILENGADVGGKITNVNGAITLTAAHVGGGIKTVNGAIDVGAGSRVEGGIYVEKPGGINAASDAVRVVIGPNAVVSGGMRFERPVNLYVSDSARISGSVEGAEATKFSGDRPPN